MPSDDIKNEWIEFKKVRKNFDCVKTRDETWFDNLEQIKLYINNNKKFISGDSYSKLVQ